LEGVRMQAGALFATGLRFSFLRRCGLFLW
jgi:hypothetical protein